MGYEPPVAFDVPPVPTDEGLRTKAAVSGQYGRHAVQQAEQPFLVVLQYRPFAYVSQTLNFIAQGNELQFSAQAGVSCTPSVRVEHTAAGIADDASDQEGLQSEQEASVAISREE